MEKATFSQAHIAQYLNNNYYPVKLNAEQREDIMFKNRSYKFVSQSGVGFNELAAELLRGQMAYPTFVFLDENLNLIQAIQGFRPPEQFEVIMTYFGEDHHKKTPWSKYEKSYKKR
jgi:thioredoxin-related protein